MTKENKRQDGGNQRRETESAHFYAIQRLDNNRYFGTYYDAGSGDAVVPSGDYPTWIEDVTSENDDLGRVYRIETIEKAREDLKSIQKNWSDRCKDGFAVVEVTIVRTMKVDVKEIN